MKKLDLGAVATAPSSAKPTHPTVPVTDAEFQTLLDQFAQINPQFKTLQNQSDTLKGQLGPRIRALFFSTFAGRAAETSTMLVTAGGRTLKLITKNAYSKGLDDDVALAAAIGQENVDRYFRQSTILKLDLDKAAEDKQEAFADAVIALAVEMGVSDAVSGVQCLQPKAGFHEARTTLLTPAENLALDALMPVTAYAQL